VPCTTLANCSGSDAARRPTWSSPAQRADASAIAAGAMSIASRAAQLRASRTVMAPLPQPSSRPDSKPRPPSASSVSAYFAAS
jgi:hypothetical protein